MAKIADELEKKWDTRLSNDYPSMSLPKRQSIIGWLLGANRERFEELNPEKLAITEKGMEYRYYILQQRYLNVSPTKAYRNLMSRLSSLAVLRNKIRTWVALSRDRQRAVMDVLQEVIQEMLNSDRYLQKQIKWISQCTADSRLRDNLLLASVEEYCLRPIRNKPLIVLRFVNFLGRQSRSGITQTPRDELVRLVSDEMETQEGDGPISLIDLQVLEDYQEMEKWEDRKRLRIAVEREFKNYLEEKVGSEAVEWLCLYLQGMSQEAISQKLNIPIKQIYRLREKINYHAVRVFALKANPELVAQWLEISLQEHNFGLTPQKWKIFWEQLNPQQRQLVQKLKQGQSLQEISEDFQWKKTQGIKEWSELYFVAQALRVSE
jgi:hypothetical protein